MQKIRQNWQKKCIRKPLGSNDLELIVVFRRLAAVTPVRAAATAGKKVPVPEALAAPMVRLVNLAVTAVKVVRHLQLLLQTHLQTLRRRHRRVLVMVLVGVREHQAIHHLTTRHLLSHLVYRPLSPIGHMIQHGIYQENLVRSGIEEFRM